MPSDSSRSLRQLTITSWSYTDRQGRRHLCMYGSTEPSGHRNGERLRDLCASHPDVHGCSQAEITTYDIGAAFDALTDMLN